MAKARKGLKQLLAEANAEIETLTSSEAVALHGAEDVVFIDLRDTAELERKGVIPGSVHIPRGSLEFAADPESPYHQQVFSSGKRFAFY